MKRTALTTVSVAALLAAGAGPAAAGADVSTARTEAAIHAQAMRAQGQHYQGQNSQGLQYNGRDLTTVAPTSPATVRVVRAPAEPSGFAWVDAGIGAGLAAALLLGAAGVATVRRHPAMTAQ